MGKQYELGDEVYVLVGDGTEQPFIKKIKIVGKRYQKNEDKKLKVVEYRGEYSSECGNNMHFTDGNWFTGNDISGDLQKLFSIVNYGINVRVIEIRKLVETREQELGLK